MCRYYTQDVIDREPWWRVWCVSQFVTEGGGINHLEWHIPSYNETFRVDLGQYNHLTRIFNARELYRSRADAWICISVVLSTAEFNRLYDYLVEQSQNDRAIDPWFFTRSICWPCPLFRSIFAWWICGCCCLCNFKQAILLRPEYDSQYVRCTEIIMEGIIECGHWDRRLQFREYNSYAKTIDINTVIKVLKSMPHREFSCRQYIDIPSLCSTTPLLSSTF